MLSKKKIVLGSKSPRRSEILSKCDIDFDIRTLDVDEVLPANIPTNEAALYLAKLKATHHMGVLQEDHEILLCADTVVVFEEEILGKPKDQDEAKNMLLKMANNWHTVFTGVCLKNKEKEVSFQVASNVLLDDISKEEVAYYVAKYQPLDKAGAYGIQEWFGHTKIVKIEGSYTNIMGLPGREVYRAIQNF